MDRRQMESAIAGVVRCLGASLKNLGLYPTTHPLVRTPVEKCHVELAPFFADRSELALTVSDGTLVLEGVPIFQLTSSLELPRSSPIDRSWPSPSRTGPSSSRGSPSSS
ncbi:MAG: hypothetical protein H6Q82_2951 [Deltaproteobacteria bacterium]|nr:hypothetical protein [Deltaproteobacteria bacterium]